MNETGKNFSNETDCDYFKISQLFLIFCPYEFVSKTSFYGCTGINKPFHADKKAVSKQKNEITVNGNSFECGDRSIYCIATGKASYLMTSALKQELELSPENIFCITTKENNPASYCISSSHPVPDESSLKAAEALINFVEDIPPQSIVFFLLSGGTSAMVCMPGNGILLQDIKKANKLLLNSGATIHEMNSVRKHVSPIKGGQLLPHFQPDCTLIDLVISDVPNDDLEDIGSGLTIPDSTTFQDAYDTLLRYGLWNEISENIKTYIEKGLTGEVYETPKPGHDPLANHHSYIIGSARMFAKKLAEQATQHGFETQIANKAFNDNVENVASFIGDKVRQNQDKPCALLFYGESTVNVTGSGKGGRNQELALRGALEIDGMDNVTWLSAGTDGIDGPTDAAGAIVDGSTITKAKESGFAPKDFIRDNNSYHFHNTMKTLIKTGPTGNNVMDIVLVLIGS